VGRGNEGQLAEQSRQSQLIDVFVRGINVCGGPLQKKDARLSPVNVRGDGGELPLPDRRARTALTGSSRRGASAR